MCSSLRQVGPLVSVPPEVVLERPLTASQILSSPASMFQNRIESLLKIFARYRALTVYRQFLEVSVRGLTKVVQKREWIYRYALAVADRTQIARHTVFAIVPETTPFNRKSMIQAVSEILL